MILWPLREALEGFRALEKERALEEWRFETLKWALLAPHGTGRKRIPPPEIPKILEEMKVDRPRR